MSDSREIRVAFTSYKKKNDGSEPDIQDTIETLVQIEYSAKSVKDCINDGRQIVGVGLRDTVESLVLNFEYILETLV